MDVSFPTRTTVQVTLPDGMQVRLLCLNSLHREEADRKARRYAQAECRSLLKGGSDYPEVIGQIRQIGVEQQALLIAGGRFWKIREEAERRFPLPVEPVFAEPEAFAPATQDWQETCKSAMDARTKFEEERFEAEKQAALKLPVKERLESCSALHFAREFTETYLKRLPIETLFRAVRVSEDPAQRFFTCVEEVEDAPDAVRTLLLSAYERLDVRPEAVPTSPPAS